MWGLNNTGQTVSWEGAGVVDADIDVPEAWAHATGSSATVVAVVDTGVAMNHPDLSGNLWQNLGESGAGRGSNGVDDDGNGYVDDQRGWDFAYGDNGPWDLRAHGTHVAGTIAAEGNNGTGIAGVAWDASIMPVKIFDAFGSSNSYLAAQALEYAARNGARVVNGSFSGVGGGELYDEVFQRYPDTLFVFSAGNDGVTNEGSYRYPCNSTQPNVLCVAWTDHKDGLASLSNYGSTTVDLGAPGSSVLSTVPRVDWVFSMNDWNAWTSTWTTGGSPNTWGVVVPVEGGTALEDSPGASYAPGTRQLDA